MGKSKYFERNALERSSFIAVEIEIAKIANSLHMLEGEIKRSQGTLIRVEKWYFVTKIVLTYCEKKLFQ